MCELTILMPCLNESETIAICIRKAKRFIKENNIDGEVLIADNGSTDGSQKIAELEGARIVNVPIKGYGSALRTGTLAAHGKYIIMGDADDSYDFLHLMPFIEKLRDGYDLVMGNRFAGGIEKGAMPWSHKYIGNPILSWIGRLFYDSKIRDFHCGLRGYNKERFIELNLVTTGMEYASEMVVKAELNGFKIAEVPTTLSKDGRSGKPHLRSFRDGWRHLKFLLLYAPNWLFLYPGLLMCMVGVTIGVMSILTNICKIGDIQLGVSSLFLAVLFLLVGIETIALYCYAKIYAKETGVLLKPNKHHFVENMTTDQGVLAGTAIAVLGVMLYIIAMMISGEMFVGLVLERTMFLVFSAVTLIGLGLEIIFFSFFIGVLKIEKK